jgi:hypothetical protein
LYNGWDKVPFIEWKTKKGFYVGLVTVEWLNATYPGRHLAEKMKIGFHALRRHPDSFYILLVGDTEIGPELVPVDDVLDSYTLLEDYNVPTGYYRRVNSDPDKVVKPSDAYFVEERDWDPGGTTLNPRPDNMETGDGKLNADVYLGRWPVRYPSEVTNLTVKTMAVTISNHIFFSSDRALSDGVTTICPSWPPPPNYEFHCYIDPMVTARHRFFELHAPHIITESMFVDLDDPAESSRFLRRFLTNQDVMVINYHGHYACLMIQSDCVAGSRIRFKYVFPLLEGESCLIGTFYYDGGASVSESILLSKTGPAIFTQSPNPTLFLRDLRDGKSVGEAFWGTASTYLYWPNPIIFLGDPSLVVFSGP